MMKHTLLSLFVLLASILVGCSADRQESMDALIERSMHLAEQKFVLMAESLAHDHSLLPRSFNQETEELITNNSKAWISGFYPGILWYLYEYTGDATLRRWAEEYTARVEEEKYNTYDHDIGFQIYCSFGNGYRLTGRKDYSDVLKTAANSAIKRFLPAVGLIRSWDVLPDRWQYPVIIDNMMNLELLMWAYQATGETVFYDVATSHANLTMRDHFRDDFSSYHVVSYDPITGIPHVKETSQGYSAESAWARGQSWGLYGFAMMYRETGYKPYLELAVNVANFLINHPAMPDDMVPFWDFDAPHIPNEPRDASAAAIMASALLILHDHVDASLQQKFIKTAETQLRSLASPEYMAEPGTNGNFLLKNSIGSKPHNSEVSVPLIYADYYFIEALLRYKQIAS